MADDQEFDRLLSNLGFGEKSFDQLVADVEGGQRQPPDIGHDILSTGLDILKRTTAEGKIAAKDAKGAWVYRGLEPFEAQTLYAAREQKPEIFSAYEKKLIEGALQGKSAVKYTPGQIMTAGGLLSPAQTALAGAAYGLEKATGLNLATMRKGARGLREIQQETVTQFETMGQTVEGWADRWSSHLSGDRKWLKEPIYQALRRSPELLAAAGGITTGMAETGQIVPFQQPGTISGKVGAMAGEALEWGLSFHSLRGLAGGKQVLSLGGLARDAVIASSASNLQNPDATAGGFARDAGLYMVIMGASIPARNALTKLVLSRGGGYADFIVKLEKAGGFKKLEAKLLKGLGRQGYKEFVENVDNTVESLFNTSWVAYKERKEKPWLLNFVSAFPAIVFANMFTERIGQLPDIASVGMRFEGAKKRARRLTGERLAEYTAGLEANKIERVMEVAQAYSEKLAETVKRAQDLNIQFTAEEQADLDRIVTALQDGTLLQAAIKKGKLEAPSLDGIIQKLAQAELRVAQDAKAAGAQGRVVELPPNVGLTVDTTPPAGPVEQEAGPAPEAVGKPTAQAIPAKVAEGQGAAVKVETPSIGDTLAETAAQTDAARPDTLEMASGVVLPKGPQPSPAAVGIPHATPGDYQAPTLEMEAAIKKASIHPKEKGRLARAGAWVKENIGGLYRSSRFVPNTPFYGEFHNAARIAKDAQRKVAAESALALMSITDTLSPDDAKLLYRFVAVSDYAHDLRKVSETGEPLYSLRFGAPDEGTIYAWERQLTQAVQKYPQVMTALNRRRAIMSAFHAELVKRGLPAGEDFQDHWHRQIMEYYNLSREQRIGRAGLKAGKPGETKPRVTQPADIEGRGTMRAVHDFNVDDYISAEMEYMMNVGRNLENARYLDRLSENYDPRVTGKYEPGVKYGEFVAGPGHPYAFTNGANQEIIDAVVKDGIAPLGVSENEMGEVNKALGSRTMILPKPMVDQLNAGQVKKGNVIAKASREILNAWKWNMTIGPINLIPYMARNQIGDITAALISAPQIFSPSLLVPALEEAWAYYGKGKFAASKDIREMMDNGGLSATMAAADLPSIRDYAVFRRFAGVQARHSSRVAQSYAESAGRLNQFRESVLRLASYKYYKSILARGGKPFLGGANRNIYAGLKSDASRAAYLGRNLIGDYGDMTELGDWVAQYVAPFWRWQEISVKRYKNIVMNIGTGVVRGDREARIAALRALTMLLATYGSMYLWNNSGDRADIEKDLNSWDKISPHLNLGRTKDGMAVIFRRTGDISDLLEWTGLGGFISRWPQIRRGDIPASEAWAEVAKAPLNKLVSSLRPEMKLPYELATGKRLFPDVTRPRPASRFEILTDVIDVREIAVGATQLLGSDKSLRPHVGLRVPFGLGIINPKATAHSETTELRNAYLRMIGRPTPPTDVQSRIKDMKDAAINDDYRAFSRALETYLTKKNGNLDKLDQSLGYLHPFSQQLNDEDEDKFYEEFLTAEQRQRARVAIEYADELRIKIEDWTYRVLGENPKLREQIGE